MPVIDTVPVHHDLARVVVEEGEGWRKCQKPHIAVVDEGLVEQVPRAIP
jgi:hypothetical protein